MRKKNLTHALCVIHLDVDFSHRAFRHRLAFITDYDPARADVGERKRHTPHNEREHNRR